MNGHVPHIFTHDRDGVASAIKHVSVSDEEALKYLEDRASGKVQSIQLPWKKWNSILTGGLELHTINIIGARSGGGKTLAATEITRGALELNPGMDLAILDLQFEMLGRNTSIRSLSKEMGMSIKKLKSADGSTLSRSELDKAKEILERNKSLPIYEVNVPLDIDAIYEVFRSFHRRIKKPFMVTLDHAMLVKKTGSQKTQLQKLEDLGDFMTATKKEFPMCWLILSQLNRNIYKPERMTPGNPLNYPQDSDISNADALLWHADNVVLFDQPLKRYLTEYGANPSWTLDPSIHKDFVAVHLVKGREGRTGMWWQKINGASQRLEEVANADYPFSPDGGSSH